MNEIVEPTQQEIKRLDPKFTWNWRKVKSVIKKKAQRLIPNVTYVIGCRGHPGIVIERNYWYNWSHQSLCGADVAIKSLVDGIEESCSIWHCSPMVISKEEAEIRVHQIKTMNAFDIALIHGYSMEKTLIWYNSWINEGLLYYVLHDQNGYEVRSNRVYTKEEAEEEVKRGNRMIDQGKWKDVSNLRIVDMLTYPAPITSFTVQ